MKPTLLIALFLLRVCVFSQAATSMNIEHIKYFPIYFTYQPILAHIGIDLDTEQEKSLSQLPQNIQSLFRTNLQIMKNYFIQGNKIDSDNKKTFLTNIELINSYDLHLLQNFDNEMTSFFSLSLYRYQVSNFPKDMDNPFIGSWNINGNNMAEFKPDFTISYDNGKRLLYMITKSTVAIQTIGDPQLILFESWKYHVISDTIIQLESDGRKAILTRIK